MYHVCFLRRGTGAFNQKNSCGVADGSGVAVEGGSAKYSLRDTGKRMKRKRNEGVNTRAHVICLRSCNGCL